MLHFWNNLTLPQKIILWLLNLPIFLVCIFVLYAIDRELFDPDGALVIAMFFCGVYSLFLIFIAFNKENKSHK